MEKWIQKEEIHKGKIFSLWGGRVSLANGETAIREYVQHPGGVAIVPVVDHNVILIRQFRIAIGRELLELPAGLLETGEEPGACARRELEEEIGYRAAELTPLASYFSSVGFADERMHIFLAMEPEKITRRLQPEEHIQEVILPIELIRQKLSRREFEDAKTIVGLHELLAHLDRNQKPADPG